MRSLTDRRRAVWFEIESVCHQAGEPVHADCADCNPTWANVCPRWSEDCDQTRPPSPPQEVKSCQTE